MNFQDDNSLVGWKTHNLQCYDISHNHDEWATISKHFFNVQNFSCVIFTLIYFFLCVAWNSRIDVSLVHTLLCAWLRLAPIFSLKSKLQVCLRLYVIVFISIYWMRLTCTLHARFDKIKLCINKIALTDVIEMDNISPHLDKEEKFLHVIWTLCELQNGLKTVQCFFLGIFPIHSTPSRDLVYDCSKKLCSCKQLRLLHRVFSLSFTPQFSHSRWRAFLLPIYPTFVCKLRAERVSLSSQGGLDGWREDNENESESTMLYESFKPHHNSRSKLKRVGIERKEKKRVKKSEEKRFNVKVGSSRRADDRACVL